MEHMKTMEELMGTLLNKAKAEVDGNIDGVDAKELGEVIDMVKDLAEAKYKCKIVKEMEDAKEEEEMMDKLDSLDDRRYYNSNRYASGRYAPSGYGNKTRNYSDNMRYPETYDVTDDFYMNKDRMYYDGTRNKASGSIARNYNESRYDRARRNYTETRMKHNTDSPDDIKENMRSSEELWDAFIDDNLDNLKNGRPEVKEMMKRKAQSFISQL